MIEFAEKPSTFLESLPVSKKDPQELLKQIEEYFDRITVRKALILTPQDFNIINFFDLLINCMKEFYFNGTTSEEITQGLDKIKKLFNEMVIQNYDLKNLKLFLIALIASYIKLVTTNENNNNTTKK
jgi:hypothetical protein